MPTPDVFLASHPSEIYLALDTLYGDDPWLSWEPETILLELKGEVSEAAKDKLLAVHAVASNLAPVLCSALAFEKVINAFSNNICAVDEFQPPYVEELLYGVRQIRQIGKLVHPEQQELNFHSEIPGYVAATAQFRDWSVLPHELSFAQEALNSLTGLSPASDRRKEHADILDTVEALYASLTTRDAERILHDPGITALAASDTGSLLTKRIVGALLYDPTLPYNHA